MSLETEQATSDHFRVRYDELKALHPQGRLYAFIDLAAMPDGWERQMTEALASSVRYPLYSDTGLDSLSQTGPFLIGCPDFLGSEAISLHGSLMALAMEDHRCVSWLWTTHDIAPLVEHLQTLLHARLGPDDEDAWFFFHQPSYLPVLHRELPAATKRYMFGPHIAWWCLDAHGQMLELTGEHLTLPSPWEALPIPTEVVDLLYREGAPAQTRAWLKTSMPYLFENNSPNVQFAQLIPTVEKAFGYGVNDKVNLGVYAAFALRYGPEYDAHPAIQNVLAQFRDAKPALIDAYAALGTGVWAEVQRTTNQRAQEMSALAYQAKCREAGYAWMKVRLFNEHDTQQKDVRLVPPEQSFRGPTSLGNISAGVYQPARVDIAKVSVPVPGTKVTMKSVAPSGWEYVCETVVDGELPQSEDEGFVVITFARNHHVYITMHAEEPNTLTPEEESMAMFGMKPRHQ